MPDGEVAAQAGQRRLVEDLGDQAEILVDHHAGAVADRDAGRLLAAVLECVETEVGELGDLFSRRPDAEDAAGVLRARAVGGRGHGSTGRRLGAPAAPFADVAVDSLAGVTNGSLRRPQQCTRAVANTDSNASIVFR